METQEKKLTETMEAQESRIMEKMNDMFEKIVGRMDKMTQELKESFSADVKAMTSEIENMKKEMNEQNQNVRKVELKTDETEKAVQELEAGIKGNEERFLKMECQSTQLQLRFRGVPETSKIDKQGMIEILAEYLDMEIQEIQYQIDIVYRINSEYAHQKKLPRDIMIFCLTRSLKEEILRKQYKQSLEIGGEKIRIMQEVPRKIMMLRKDYKKLTDKLNGLNIRFRWEVPQGVTFEYRGKRHMIRNVQQMEQCLKDWTD